MHDQRARPPCTMAWVRRGARTGCQGERTSRVSVFEPLGPRHGPLMSVRVSNSTKVCCRPAEDRGITAVPPVESSPSPAAELLAVSVNWAGRAAIVTARLRALSPRGAKGVMARRIGPTTPWGSGGRISDRTRPLQVCKWRGWGGGVGGD